MAASLQTSCDSVWALVVVVLPGSEPQADVSGGDDSSPLDIDRDFLQTCMVIMWMIICMNNMRNLALLCNHTFNCHWMQDSS